MDEKELKAKVFDLSIARDRIQAQINQCLNEIAKIQAEQQKGVIKKESEN
jgi:hypothetical protein